MVNNLEKQNINVDLMPMEEEYKFTTSFLLNHQLLTNILLRKETTDVKINKSLKKEKETAFGIVRDIIRRNYGVYMRGSVLVTHPEESEHLE